MAQVHQPGTLLSLPDELILQIVSYFKAVRSEEPQSQAFQDKKQEKDRQRQNRRDQAILYSVCLASQKLNRVSTPILYSSFLGVTTLRGIGLLSSFLATVTSRAGLGDHIEYVENRLSDYLGNDLLHDMDYHAAETMVVEYFVKLAILVRRAPNIRHLCVVSIESLDVSFWGHLLPDHSLVYRTTIAEHGFPKLKTLALQTNSKNKYAQISPAASFSVVFTALGAATSLTKLCASGLVFGLPAQAWQPFENLRHVDLTEVESDFIDVDRLLDACNELQRFTCQWAYLNMRYTCTDLLPSLTKHKETLRTLWLMASASQYDTANTPVVKFDSLASLKVLEEAKLCNFGVRDRHAFPPGTAWSSPLLRAELPTSIEHLTIVYPRVWADTGEYSWDVLSELWRFAENPAIKLPRLRELVVEFAEGGPLYRYDIATGASQGGTEMLTSRFINLGITFKTVGQAGGFEPM